MGLRIYQHPLVVVEWLLGKARQLTEDKRRPSWWLVVVGDREMVLVGHSRRIYIVKIRHKYRMNVTFSV